MTDENGYKIVSEYIDRAKMGTNDRREELQRMIRDSDDGDFEVVIVQAGQIRTQALRQRNIQKSP